MNRTDPAICSLLFGNQMAGLMISIGKPRTKRPCIVIFPGGGYEMLSKREADPVAFEFFNRGYQVFILYYSLKENAKNMQVLMEGSAALMTIFLVNALQKCKISYECHLYPHGGHGMSVCTAEVGSPNPRARSWVTLCGEWLEELFSFPQ